MYVHFYDLAHVYVHLQDLAHVHPFLVPRSCASPDPATNFGHFSLTYLKLYKLPTKLLHTYSNKAAIYLCLFKENPMKAEGHDMLCISPVNRSHVSGVQQHQVALLLRTIKPNGHQDPIILIKTFWIRNKTSLTIIVVFLMKYILHQTQEQFFSYQREPFLPSLATNIPLNNGLPGIVQSNPAVYPAVLLPTVPRVVLVSPYPDPQLENPTQCQCKLQKQVSAFSYFSLMVGKSN